MKRILMASAFFPPMFGGAVVQALTLSRALRQKGYQVEFFTNNFKNKSVTEDYEGFSVRRVQSFAHLESKFSEAIYSVKILLFALLRKDIEIFHFHSVAGFELFIFPILRLCGKKVILKLTLMGSDDPLTFKRRKRLGWLYFQGLRCANSLIAISQGLRNMSLEAGISDKKIKLIDNGLNIEKFFPVNHDEKQRIRIDLNLASFSKIFISIGQVEPRKGYDFLLQAWEKISEKIDNAVLLIAGPNNNESNPFYCQLQRFLQERGLTNVLFLGKIENAPVYFRASDCFLFCSKAEGFGTVMIEAMACGVPVVALHIEGITDFILNDRDISDVCSTREPQDFADKAVSVLKIEKERRTKASEKIRIKYDIDAIAQQYDDLYQQLLGEGHG